MAEAGTRSRASEKKQDRAHAAAERAVKGFERDARSCKSPTVPNDICVLQLVPDSDRLVCTAVDYAIQGDLHPAQEVVRAHHVLVVDL